MNRLLIPNTCQVPNVLLEKIMPRLSGRSLKVLLVIVRKTYGFHKRSDKISFRTLQELTGLSRDAVNRGIKGLGSLLIIVPGVKGNPKLEGINEYALNLDVETGALVRESDWSEKKTSPKNPDELVLKSDSSKPNSSKPNSSRKKRARLRDNPESLEAFEEFYRAYPKHVAKEAAEQAWMKLNPAADLCATIMAGVTRYADQVRDWEKRYIANPATWLNGRRWEDEPDSAAGRDVSSARPLPEDALDYGESAHA